MSLDWFSTWWQFVDNRYIQVAKDGHGEGTRNRSRGHHQDVRVTESFVPDSFSLEDSKSVLFIDNHKPETLKIDPFLNEGMRSNRNLSRTGLDPLVSTFSISTSQFAN